MMNVRHIPSDEVAYTAKLQGLAVQCDHTGLHVYQALLQRQDACAKYPAQMAADKSLLTPSMSLGKYAWNNMNAPELNCPNCLETLQRLNVHSWVLMTLVINAKT